MGELLGVVLIVLILIFEFVDYKRNKEEDRWR